MSYMYLMEWFSSILPLERNGIRPRRNPRHLTKMNEVVESANEENGQTKLIRDGPGKQCPPAGESDAANNHDLLQSCQCGNNQLLHIHFPDRTETSALSREGQQR